MFIAGGGVVVLAAAGAAALVLPRLFAPVAPAQAELPAGDLSVELAQPAPGGDMAIGSDKAPVTIIEYASMTCPHCAHFSETTFPELKKRYIDTGKVRFIFREFPLDKLAAAGFMLARCASKDGGGERYMAVVETLFAKQQEWVVPDNPVPPLENIAKQFGFTEESFNACLKDQSIMNGIEAVRDRAAA
jgi:protein-disulfide isomerase